MPATSPSPATRPALRSRPPSTTASTAGLGGKVSSPRTPLLGRSISSQFGSPAAFRSEPDEQIVYELDARYLRAGFAGESRPRSTYAFTPDTGRRGGDYRAYNLRKPARARRKRGGNGEKEADYEAWGREHEVYRTDTRALDLGLVEDKLERAVRSLHTTSLQLDTKPRKAVLAIPSLLPTPLLEIMLKVLFDHHQQPPSVTVLTTPVLAVVGAGLRDGLVVEVGWEETVVTAVGELREVGQRRSVRGEKMLAWEMRKALEQVENSNISDDEERSDPTTGLEEAEEALRQIGSCPPFSPTEPANPTPLESTFFPPIPSHPDDHDLPLAHLAHSLLLSLPPDLRRLCTTRLILTGGPTRLPGFKQRFLKELQHLISTRGWSRVKNFGSATAAERGREGRAVGKVKPHNLRTSPENLKADPPSMAGRSVASTSTAPLPVLPTHQRPRDDVSDPLTRKAERHCRPVNPEPWHLSQMPGAADSGLEMGAAAGVRGVETLGAWASASLVAGVRVKGVREVGREEFLRVGGLGLGEGLF
ncbi:hypothetical protein B0A50_00292 [Salinomyces thailandicus]|uniref:Actin-like ATPase domain-containing protein n=1 Tax=Salinomyces thailandicus TaxID=706561 RepID=A0A4U0UH24_9PEZI|nr:hypothetical protein B0A50_00292 [Salinomyces thailandica]